MRHWLLLLCVFVFPTLCAQDMSSFSSLQDLKNASKSPNLQITDSPEIEYPVDENEYVVGPGDVFQILIGGSTEDEQQLVITPEGTIVVPAVGGIYIAGEILKDAKEKIIERLGELYLKQNIVITLVQLRTFRVTVSGAVLFPGLVSVRAMDRVSDAILMAGGLIEESTMLMEIEDPRKERGGTQKPKAQTEHYKEQKKYLENNSASKRNIIVKRRDGRVLGADLILYTRGGDLDANPHLVDGDVIIVPTLDQDYYEVMIGGAVRTPDAFEYARGDRVRDLLAMAHGFTFNADSTTIYISRFDPETKRIAEIAYDINWQDPQSVSRMMDMHVLPDDRIMVRSNPIMHRNRTVTIEGQVHRPGDYALIDSTTLSEMIELAGGFTDMASLNAAHIIRRSYEDKEDVEFDRLDLMMYSDMEPKEKAYYRELSRELKGLVSTDFVELFKNGNKEFDVELEDEDLIVIPEKENAVYVFGHVNRPGFVEYVEGENAKFYIEKAGGYGVNVWKKKVRIKKAGTGQLKYIADTTIEMGDAILVPEKVERMPWESFRNVVFLVAQIGTLTIALLQLQYLSRN